MKLFSVGSVPSIVYLMTVPSGASSGRDSVREKVSVNIFPGMSNIGSPSISLYRDTQFDSPGVGTA